MIQERAPIPGEQVREAIDGIVAPNRVREGIDAILDRDEFNDEPTMLDEFLEWIGELFEGMGISAATAETVLWVFVTAMGLLFLTLVVWIIVSVVRQRRAARAPADAPRGPTSRERAAGLRLRAHEARAAGDLRLALRLDLFALMVGLGARGNLRYRDAWTNRELLRRGEPAKGTYELLAPLVEELEGKDFGSEETTSEDVDRLEALCTQHLGALELENGEATR